MTKLHQLSQRPPREGMLDIGLHSVSTMYCQCRQPSHCCICLGLVHIFTPISRSHCNHSMSRLEMVQQKRADIQLSFRKSKFISYLKETPDSACTNSQQTVWRTIVRACAAFQLSSYLHVSVISRCIVSRLTTEETSESE